ncbi:hypothetical protein DHEL01_v212238 [Diaporthe helianthi]|uniref:Aflatoxin regulatory protein domain-containing protein n=1 Tax=Diaporthe helianthi TaxID=158607 RepID=A0A2P5HGI9_DIAHE|nr:hypothetical protein DHEL01_v212238 [Diaporthe helianthi]
MFQTLRQETQGDRQLIAETTRAPHSTAEAAGSTEAAQAPPSSVGPAPADSSASETMEDAGPDMFDHDASLYEFLHAEATFEPHEPAVSDALFFDAVGMVPPSSLHGTMSLGDCFAQDHAQQGAFSQTAAPGAGALVATSLSSALPGNSGHSHRPAGSSSSSNSNFGPSRQGCGCFDLLRTFEAVEIYLVWATRGSSPGCRSFRVDEVLSCQKEVLERCELRLQCGEYPLKSWDAMLLICIFEKVLASILQLIAAGDPGPTTQSPRRPPSSQRRQSFLNPESSPASVMENVFIKSHSTGTGFPEWKFDEEDQRQVLQSLLCSRLTRLGALIKRLEEVAMSNHWLVPHMSMIRGLSDQISRARPNRTDDQWPR